MLIPHFVKKDWGWENWFANVQEPNGPDYCGKIIYIEHGKWSSNFKYHYHKIKDETFVVLEGILQIDFYADDSTPNTIYLNPHQTFRVKPGMKHRFTSVSHTGCKFVEVSTFHSDNDSYRCEYDVATGSWIE
jgi:mannose-6-phosphate isomerase-like protein (cupin superfamily)